jgi:hypothetical protein
MDFFIEISIIDFNLSKLMPTLISFSGSKVERANALLMEMNMRWKMVMRMQM